jgi:protein-S-isoprenylcysteine O-methyltransferase Ste14
MGGSYAAGHDRGPVVTHRGVRLPPLLALLFALMVYGAVDVAAPLLVSTLGDTGGPHVLGLLPMAGGAVLLVWAGTVHARAISELEWRFRVDRQHLLTPDHLVTDGPYARSRNPLYVGDLLVWAGWAALLASLPVAVGAVVLLVGLSVGVRLEERGRAGKFGERWRAYAAVTPRFVGVPGRRR